MLTEQKNLLLTVIVRRWQVKMAGLEPNLFITFEGIDGAGKGSQLVKLFDLITNDELLMMRMVF